MKNLLYLLLLSTGICNAQIVNIPDANFKAKLISLGIDSNNSGEIDTFETTLVSDLHLENSSINNLIGIGAFTNLNDLYCNGNNLTFLDLSSNVNLTYLNCRLNQINYLNLSNNPNLINVLADNNELNGINISNNPSLDVLWISNNNLITINTTSCVNLTEFLCSNNNLTSLNISDSISITDLQCNNNQLTTLNLSSLNQLQKLDCSFNQLTSLDVSGLSSLTTLFCYYNQITSLDVSGLNNLLSFYCNHNQITEINLTGVTKLWILHAEFNQLTTLDVSGIINYDVFVDCSDNNLTSLFIKNNRNVILDNTGLYCQCSGNMYFFNNPNLAFVCCDEGEISSIQAYSGTTNYSNFIANSYCSFTPGGNYNTITGNIKYDSNNNGCDANDVVFPNIRMNFNEINNQGASFTNNSGNYTFFTQAGTFTLIPGMENPTWFTYSPVTADVVFADNNNNTATQDFCITPNGLHLDVETVISHLTNARPGFDAVYKLVIKNKGNQTQSGLLSFTYNEEILDYVSSSQLPEIQSEGAISWYYDDLLPFESRSILVTLNVNSPTETPAVNIGDHLIYIVSSYPSEIDETPADNQFTYNQTVVGSFDPNDITCLEGELLPPSTIGNYLHYAVNFENTGNYPAENVVVKIDIDPTKFDVNSLQLLNNSHPVDARITGNKVEFIFENILLDTNGHGHILLKIKSKDTVVSGETVTKRADIFFDYNFPVDTGMASTTFQTLSNAGFELDDSIGIYPNPTSSTININSNFNIKSIQVYDIQGRILETVLGNNKMLDITDKSNGVYFLKITTDKGSKIEKVVKE